jgi:hypothetical protein
MLDIELCIDGDCGKRDENANRSGGKFVPYPSSTKVVRDRASDNVSERVSSSC